jgi:hypothetical protein
MRFSAILHRGDIVLAPFPFTDRPAVNKSSLRLRDEGNFSVVPPCLMVQQPDLITDYRSLITDYRSLITGYWLLALGGAEGTRTPDLLNAIETRSQLRYSPTLSIRSLAR